MRVEWSEFLAIDPEAGFDSRHHQKKKLVGLELGPLSLVSTTDEILDRKISGYCLENLEYGRRDPSRWPRGILYPQKLASLRRQATVARSVLFVRGPRPWSLVFRFLWGSLNQTRKLELLCDIYSLSKTFQNDCQMFSFFSEISKNQSENCVSCYVPAMQPCFQEPRSHCCKHRVVCFSSGWPAACNTTTWTLPSQEGVMADLSVSGFHCKYDCILHPAAPSHAPTPSSVCVQVYVIKDLAEKFNHFISRPSPRQTQGTNWIGI
jgi:hypothetical protein